MVRPGKQPSPPTSTHHIPSRAVGYGEKIYTHALPNAQETHRNAPRDLPLSRPDDARPGTLAARRIHVSRLWDLLHLLLARRDAARAGRALRALMQCHEWRSMELWRLGLQVAALHGAAEGSSKEEAEAKIKYLRGLMRRRGAARAQLMIELVPALIAVGKAREALEEITLSINTYPYRVESQLHLYAGLLVLHLSTLTLSSSSKSRTHTNASPSTPAERAAFIHASLFEPAHEQILRAATHHFDGAVAAAANKRAVSQRLRKYDQRLEEKRALKRSQTAERGPSVGEKRGREALSDAETDVEMEPRPEVQPRASTRASDEEEEDDRNDEEEQDPDNEQEEQDDDVPSSDWAEDLAKAYLELIHNPPKPSSASSSESSSSSEEEEEDSHVMDLDDSRQGRSRVYVEV